MKINQASLLKISAVTIAIPRYAGAFALSAGFVATGQLHSYLGVAEIVAGVAMAVLEGFALAFILSKWRLLKSSTAPWYALLIVSFLLALSLPLVAIPYLFFMQSRPDGVTELFGSIVVQNSWNFIVAFSPMLVVIGVGLADVNELEREEREIDFQLAVSRKKAGLEQELSKLKLEVEQDRVAGELKLSKLQLEVEKDRVANELEIRKLRAGHKIETSKVEAMVQESLSNPFTCESCGVHFQEERQLRGHKAHCKARVNGTVKIPDVEL